ncbi:Vacuolar-sorting protein SNF7 AltName: Full=Vacuolar protein-sorting-associated protein 32 [Serendipita indica DSM 11827]|uniref:Vacuolar-sorting protein SNF7 n=1 Tax=Serendipita indica (strain DSM 11827) TaxID=1109443 RepID=G4TKE7_SERID|nr:Vacuolar-sorting protein SNF7 AltName: Full=Vacuolar protein-sorting-associated protein 32 [Serendipita indica DSM 11827]CCA71790.1 related to SNF7 protein [Serendipita indica DSM 11827]
MSGWISYFTGARDTKATTRQAIVGLREQLSMLDKKEEHLEKKIAEETKKARENATTNKSAALAALRRKKTYEQQLEQLSGTRLTLEAQANAIESANMNAETMLAMKRGANALKDIHKQLNVDKVDATMDEIREEMERTKEIADAISNPMNVGVDLDEDDLKEELKDLEQEVLDEKLAGAAHVPVHTPAGPSRVAERPKVVAEDDEEAQLRELQASLALSS